MSVSESRGGAPVLGAALKRGRSEILSRWEATPRGTAAYATDRAAVRRDLAMLLDTVTDVLLGRAEFEVALRDLHWSSMPVELEHEHALAALLREFAHLRQATLGWLDDQGHEVTAGALAAFSDAVDRAAEAALMANLSLRQRILQGMDRIAHTRYRDRRIEAVLASLGEIILQMGTADTVLLFLLEGDRLRVRASLGAGDDLAPSLAPAVGEGFVGEVARARAPQTLDGLDPAALARHGLTGLDVSTLYGVPLLADTELVGVALLGSRGALSDGDRLLFRWMASRAGLMVESVLADARSRAVAAIMRALAASSTISTGARSLLEELGETLRWDVGVFWTVQGGRLRYLTGWTAAPGFEDFLERSRDTSFAPGDHLPGEAWTSDRAEWISDIARDPAFSRGATAAQVGLRSGMALALRSPGELFGVVEFFRRHVQSPAEAGLQVTEIVAPQVSDFLQRVRAADEIRRGREQAAEAARRQQLMADVSRALTVSEGHP